MDGYEEMSQSRGGRRLLIVGGGAIVVVAAAAAIVRFAFPGLPQISETDLAAAEQRWNEARVKNYDIGIRLSGRQTGELYCAVREGFAIGLRRNGVEMKQERTWQPWTVPGMFETLAIDFENAKKPAEKFGSPDVKVVLRCEFDEKYGYPRRYLHQVFGRSNDLHWEVFEFTPQAAEAR